MKKQFSLFAMALAATIVTPAVAETTYVRANSTADLDNSYTTRNYVRTNQGNVYAAQPVKRSELYRNTTTTTRTTRTTSTRTELKRKYYLAHPFFQPVAGKFGSVTDFSLLNNTMDLTLANRPSEGVVDFNIGDTAVAWKTRQFAVKEDFSFGITDKLALVAMGRYEKTKYKQDWENENNPDDSMNGDNGFNLFGFGVQYRFMDTPDWIGMLSGYYQRQKDTSNNILLDLKAGYKVKSTTLYGMLRGQYVDFDEKIVGFAMNGEDANGVNMTTIMAYDSNVKDAFYVYGGVGLFSVLGEDWTLNLEGTYGDYKWYNQAAIRGAIGWQPNDWFALNLYAQAALMYDLDSDMEVWEKNGVIKISGVDTRWPDWVKMGTADVDDYKEYTVGLQAIFMF